MAHICVMHAQQDSFDSTENKDSLSDHMADKRLGRDTSCKRYTTHKTLSSYCNKLFSPDSTAFFYKIICQYHKPNYIL